MEPELLGGAVELAGGLGELPLQAPLVGAQGIEPVDERGQPGALLRRDRSELGTDPSEVAAQAVPAPPGYTLPWTWPWTAVGTFLFPTTQTTAS